MALVETRSPPTLTVMTALLPVAGGTASIAAGSSVAATSGSPASPARGSSAAKGRRDLSADWRTESAMTDR